MIVVLSLSLFGRVEKQPGSGGVSGVCVGQVVLDEQGPAGRFPTCSLPSSSKLAAREHVLRLNGALSGSAQDGTVLTSCI